LPAKATTADLRTLVDQLFLISGPPLHLPIRRSTYKPHAGPH